MAITPSPSDRTLTRILDSSHTIVGIDKSIEANTKSMADGINEITKFLIGGTTGDSKGGAKSKSKVTKKEKPKQTLESIIGLSVNDLTELSTLEPKEVNRINAFIGKLNKTLSEIENPVLMKEKGAALETMLSSLGLITKEFFTNISSIANFKDFNLISKFIGGITPIFTNIKNSKEAEEGAKSVTAIISALSGITADLSKGLSGFKKIKLRQVNRIRKFMAVFPKIFSDIKDPVKAKEGAEAISVIATALKSISSNILSSTLKLIPVIPLMGVIGITIRKLVKYFIIAGEKSKEIKKGVESLEPVSKLLKSLAGGIVVLGVAAIAAPLAIIALAAIGKTFMVLGVRSRLIRRGARAMKSIGLSMIMMGAGILAIGGSVAILMAIHPALPLVVPAMILAVGLAFAVAGKMPIKMGALSLGLASIALVGLAFGMLAIGKVVTAVGAVEILKGIGLIAVIGLVFGIAGAGPIPLFIGLGALALGLAGLSLMALGKGMEMFAVATKDLTLKSSAIMVAAIVGLGVAFAGIGLASPLILAGGVAALSIGAAMLSISAGVDAVKKANYFKDFDTKKFAEVVVGIGAAFAMVGQTGGEGKGGVLGWLTGIELGPNNVERGIKSVLQANSAMQSIAEGLVSFQTLTSSIDFGIGEDGKPIPGGLISTMGLVIGSVSTIFAGIGKADKTGQSYIKLIFGDDFSEGAVEQGIIITKTAGGALMSMAEGLKTFNDFVKNELGGFGSGGDEKLDTISQGIASVIGTVGSAFSSLGKKDDRGWFDWSDNNAEEGASLAQKYGGILESLATGLGAFSSLGKIPTITGYKTGPNGEQIPIYGAPVSIKDTANNIKDFIGLTAEVLIEMSSKMDQANGSFKVSRVWTTFTNDLLRLSKAADPFDKFANAFVNMAGGMKIFSSAFNDMGTPAAMVAFTNWTEALLKLSEAGDESFIDKVKGAVFGKAEEGVNVMYAAGAELSGDSSERQSIIERSNEQSGDAAAAAQTSAILNGLEKLSANINSLKTSLLSQGIDVNVIGVDGNVTIQTIEQP